MTRPVVVGALPRTGPVVVAANHLAEIDSLLLALVLPRRLTFVAKSEYFAPRGLRGRLYSNIARSTGQIPIDRSGSGAGDAALDAARRILEDGGIWAIYPEGTRSPDGRLYRGRTGVMRVALACPDAAVVPVGIRGTRAIDHPAKRGWRPGRVRVDIGQPMDLSRWYGRSGDEAATREATDELMRQIQALSSQPYVGRHPTTQEQARRGQPT
ncbi:lysophospholipid acyltransferase family protein [Nocardioides korecus]